MESYFFSNSARHQNLIDESRQRDKDGHLVAKSVQIKKTGADRKSVSKLKEDGKLANDGS